LIAEWEPDSDNHAMFYRQLAIDKDPVKAAEATWSHGQFTRLGAQLIPQIGITDFIIHHL